MEIQYTIKEIAERIKELREVTGISPEKMASLTDVTLQEYVACENGEVNLNFAFIYRCAQALGVDVTDIISGSSPRLSSYTVCRRGMGQRIDRAHGMVYYNMAPYFKNRIAEPLYVEAIYSDEAQRRPIDVTTHAGQECDIVIKGHLKVKVGNHYEILGEGDSIYYNSSAPHGMIAVGGENCLFYAIVLNPTGEPIPEISGANLELKTERPEIQQETEEHRVYDDFVCPVEDVDGALKSISFKNEDMFNFAFDVVDALGKSKPDKLAMLHVAMDKTVRRFTFSDMMHMSSRAANYFKSLGIKRGDRVMLVLRRNWQYWPILVGLHKIGAVAIPATDQLLKKDYEYRFSAAGVCAIICTTFGEAADHIEEALETSPMVKIKIIVDGKRNGWRSFDDEYELYRSTYTRYDDAPCGDDPMLMYFTSGTTGNPKMALHTYKYPLGHFITAKYWQQVDPNGLHLTISDTGWAKAAWGKIYGQWLCEAAIFVYDFDRFHADDILPLFKEFGVTTFCAPPTMYRFFIKEDLSKYDLSSIKHASTAGEALNLEVINQFKKATGLSIMEGFGQSEGTVIIGNFVGMTPKPGSMGKPSPLYDVCLLDQDGNQVGDGETGEICINVSQHIPCGLFKEYFRDEEKTAEVWHDGYYHTGDTAWRDEDGYYWYVGRADDVIKSSGYRIGPFEIESVIMELPYVLECGVSPEPDAVRGQVVKASIVLTRGTEGTDELKKEIQAYVKRRTAPYKYPRIVVFRDSLPKTTSGKIQRNKL